MFLSVWIFGHPYTYWHVSNLAGQFQTIKLQETKIEYHSDEKALDMVSV